MDTWSTKIEGVFDENLLGLRYGKIFFDQWLNFGPSIFDEVRTSSSAFFLGSSTSFKMFEASRTISFELDGANSWSGSGNGILRLS